MNRLRFLIQNKYWFLSFFMLSFILRMSFPHLKFLFFPLLIFALFYSILYGRSRIMGPARSYLTLVPFAGVLLFFGVPLITSDFQSLLIREVIYGFTGLWVAVLFLWMVRSPQEMQRFRDQFLAVLVGLTVLICLVSITLFFEDFLQADSGKAFQFYLASDYNFYALSLIYGLLAGAGFMLCKGFTGYRKVLMSLFLLLLVVFIFFSSSRRAFTFLLIFLAILYILRLTGVFVRKSFLQMLKRLDLFTITSLVILIFAIGWFYYTSPQLKRKVIVSSGLYRSNTPVKMKNLLSRYYSVAGLLNGSEYIYHAFYNTDDSRPYKTKTSWLSSKLDDLFLDKTEMKLCFPAHANQHWVSKGAAKIYPEHKRQKEPILAFDSWNRGWVQNWFYTARGETIRFELEYTSSDDQELSLFLPDEETNTIGEIKSSGYSVDDTLHRIAFTQHYERFGNHPFWLGKLEGKDRTGFVLRRLKIHVLQDSAGNSTSKDKHLRDNGLIQTRKVCELKEIEQAIDSPKDMEPNMVSDQKYAYGRLAKWEFGWSLFLDSSIIEKLFGSGFGYTSQYSETFFHSQKVDYPHNIFLSALLYSGIIGLAALLLYFIVGIWLAIRYFSSYPVLGLLYLLTFVFSVISGNSFFSVPAHVIFSLLPFLIHSTQITVPNRTKNA